VRGCEAARHHVTTILESDYPQRHTVTTQIEKSNIYFLPRSTLCPSPWPWSIGLMSKVLCVDCPPPFLACKETFRASGELGAQPLADLMTSIRKLTFLQDLTFSFPARRPGHLSSYWGFPKPRTDKGDPMISDSKGRVHTY
jgi:hypothetical protein